MARSTELPPTRIVTWEIWATLRRAATVPRRSAGGGSTTATAAATTAFRDYLRGVADRLQWSHRGQRGGVRHHCHRCHRGQATEVRVRGALMRADTEAPAAEQGQIVGPTGGHD